MGEKSSVGIAHPSVIARDTDHLKRDLEAASPPTFDVLVTLSHEVRVALNSIAGYSEMLADAALATRSSPQGGDVPRRIERNVRDLTEWVGSALELVRVKLDGGVPHSYPQDTRKQGLA